MLKKIVFQPGINREGTSYSAEGGWYNSDKIRFRKGRPEKIGGWVEYSEDTFLGVCRSLHNWLTLAGDNYLGLGTSSKVYVEFGTKFYDITPSYDYSTSTSPGPSFLAANLIEEGTDLDITDGDIAAKGWIVGDVGRVSTPFVSSAPQSEAGPFEYVHVTGKSEGTGVGGSDRLFVTRAYFGSVEQEHYWSETVRPTIERIPKAAVIASPSTTDTGGPVGFMYESEAVLIRQDGHGCIAGDYVTFLQIGATFDPMGSVGNQFDDSDILVPAGFRVTRALDTSNYEISVPAAKEKITGGAGYLSAVKSGTLSEAISGTSTSIKIASEDDGWDGLTTDFWIKIDDEYIRISSVTGTESPFTLTVSGGEPGRGQFGSTAANHDSAGTGKTAAAVSEVVFECPGNTYLLHDVNTGPSVFSYSSGWGRSSWGEGAWGVAVGATAGPNIETSGVRIWSVDNYGEDLVLCPRDGTPYYWDASQKKDSSGIIDTSPSSAGPLVTLDVANAQAVPLSSIGSYADPGYSYVQEGLDRLENAVSHAPSRVRQLMVFPQSKMLIAFGCSDRGGNFNPMLVRWSSDANPGSWDPIANGDPGPGTTGFIPLTVGSEIIAAARSKMEILIWTDAAVYNMTWAGGVNLFSVAQLSTDISIMGPIAYAVSQDKIYWMGDRNFYVYDGSIGIVPCTVLEHVFTDLNYGQKRLIYAASNTEFSEVSFFYCSGDSFEIDKYASYNYEENVWSIGEMDRTAWSDSGLKKNPFAARIISNSLNTSKIYSHEYGYNDVNKETGEMIPMQSFIESGYFDIDDGDHFSFISRIIPDVMFSPGTGGGYENPMEIAVKKKDFPNDDDESSGSVSTVQRDTKQNHIRVRGRQASVKFSTDGEGVGWRLGDSRIDIKPDGRR